MIINKFFSDLSIPEGTCGDYSIKHEIINPGTELAVVSPRDAMFQGRKTVSIKTDQIRTIHKLIEIGKNDKGKTSSCVAWMTDFPYEVFSHHEDIDGFSGKILLGGLGLGVAVSILEKNKNVTEITVIDQCSALQKLVWPYLKIEKTKLIIDDLFEYLKKCTEKYDFAYYDIWAPSGEFIHEQFVLPLRRLSHNIVDMSNLKCWEEETMLGQIKFSLLQSMEAARAREKAEKNIDMDRKLKEYLLGQPTLWSVSDETFIKWKELAPVKWMFWNWFRTERPDESEANKKLKYFVDSLKDPVLLDQNWSRWN